MKKLLIKLLIKIKLVRLAYRIDPDITIVILFPEIVNNMNEAFKQIGEKLVPALQNMIDSIEKLTEEINK